MSKWGKNHGLIVPIDSLLKEKENTNRPTPLRSAGLVGRWGITSFTSIRNTTYEFESTSPKQSEELNCSSNLESLSTQVPAAPKPKKFFKSRNVLPPPTPDPHRQDAAVPHHHMQQVLHHQAAQLQARINQKAGGSPPYSPGAAFYQPKATASSKSPGKFEDKPVVAAKKRGRKKKIKPEEQPVVEGEESAAPLEIKPEAKTKVEPKKEKKEKKQKKPKKEVEAPPEAPRRSSGRSRNVVSYNEDDDSFDSIIRLRQGAQDTPPLGPSKLAGEPPTLEEADSEQEEQAEEPAAEAAVPTPAPVPTVPVPVAVSPAAKSGSGSGAEDRVVKTVKIPVPLSSPSVVEHPPIVLRISKGTSRLVSTDSEGVYSPPHAAPLTPAHHSVPTPPVVTTPKRLEQEPPVKVASPATRAPSPPLPVEVESPAPESASVPPVEQQPEVEPRKDDLKIKISLSKSLISNGSGNSSSKSKKESKKELRHFKKRAIAREKGRASKRAKRGTGVEEFDHPEEEEEVVNRDEDLLAGVADDLRVDPIVLPISRPTFPLPGTDAYELYRTLASPSGNDDFDSQSSILGSASSNNTPQHAGAAAAEDCRIIHSRGSSDCGSDLELSQNSQNSQNSSTAAAPPSEINFESENTQDNKEEEPKDQTKVVEETKDPPPREERVQVLKLSLKVTKPARATRSSKMKQHVEVITKPEPIPVPTVVPSSVEPPVKKFGRSTRNRNNNNNVVEAVAEPPKTKEPTPEPVREPSPPPAPVKAATRQYGRRKKNVVPEDYQPDPSPLTSPNRQPVIDPQPDPFTLASGSETSVVQIPSSISSASTGLDLTTSASRTAPPPTTVPTPFQDENKPEPTEYKIKNKFKKSYFRSEELAKQQQQLLQQQESRPLAETPGNGPASGVPSAAPASTLTVPPITIPLSSIGAASAEPSQQQPVKLVISKKKGSIFKSRPLTGSAEAADKKRHMYKHKWDDDGDGDGGKDKGDLADGENEQQVDTFEGEPSGLSRVTRIRNSGGGNSSMDFEDDDFEVDNKLRCDRGVKPFYTVVRNVKNAHQIQEIGEFQEMDDDVEYILSALQPDNPSATRCLSAMTLATKCMTPAFRMHVRAHGVGTRIFKALRDAHLDQGLGLCTAAIMFVLSQDTLNMDLDRDSLELMLNLLDTDHRSGSTEGGMTRGQLEKNKQKVRELCEEIKNSGKAKHMDLDHFSVGSLAMESLLSLTSKRAGDWFKDELRNLGGLEHLIKTVSDCCKEISDYVVEWTDDLLSKLRKIERCLRVLENVTLLNEQNQSYILNYNNGSLILTLAKLFKLIDSEVVLYPTNESTPKEDRGAVLREVIPPVLKIFISLTHPFNEAAYGATVLGSQPHVIATTLHLLLRIGDYVPQKLIFEINILVLLFLINLTMYTQANRQLLMTARVPDEFNNPSSSSSVPASSDGTQIAIQALVEYFYRQDELARYAEKNTDAILDAKSKTREDIEETVTKLLQKAGHHMEHTLMASYVCLLIGWIVIGSEDNERIVRTYLKDNNFVMMVTSLEKYYNFLNLTANSDALSLQHVRQTKNIIDQLKRLDSAERSTAEPSTSRGHLQQSESSTSATSSSNATPQRYGSRSSNRLHY
ncbi:protein wings apart-like [Uranotaenia lowii]|uniref:protein wings apart-like n=1 Tax=Uranotaenia lowii TaxID=190385 RepID=UPI002479B75D|nr:protein wings apart-like [Uranotaenia lowii]